MRTAVDTNILSALWSGEPSSSRVVRDLREAKQSGALVVSGVVYAELLAHPKATEVFIAEFLDQTGMVLDFQLIDEVWLEAGRRFARYANRRRRAKDETPKRLPADFLAGAHALIQADRLLTLDPVRYKLDFPELRL